MGQKTIFTYDKALGLPTSLMDANNVTTSATYDAYGRMPTIVRLSDDGTNPTIQLSYHTASAPFLNNLF